MYTFNWVDNQALFQPRVNLMYVNLHRLTKSAALSPTSATRPDAAILPLGMRNRLL